VFRDAQLPDDQAFRVFENLLEDTLSIGGVFVANFHPHNLVDRLPLYKSILKLVTQKKSAGTLVATAAELVKLFGKENLR
jgi:hypothetical protein